MVLLSTGFDQQCCMTVYDGEETDEELRSFSFLSFVLKERERERDSLSLRQNTCGKTLWNDKNKYFFTQYIIRLEGSLSSEVRQTTVTFKGGLSFCVNNKNT